MTLGPPCAAPPTQTSPQSASLMTQCGRGPQAEGKGHILNRMIQCSVHWLHQNCQIYMYNDILLAIGITCELQWNLSNPDTLGTEESVLISEVS